MKLDRKKVSPMLAKLSDEPFDSKEWIFEIKWDGYRALAFKNEKVDLVSRNQKSFNARFPSIVKELQKLSCTCILDGEIVILDQKGRSNFQLLQNYQKSKEGVSYFYIFDILSYNGKDITKHSLIQRKEILKKLIHKKFQFLKFSDHVDEKGKAFFRLACKKDLEGIIAKKKDSSYQFRRSSDWLKIKAKLRQEVVIGGFTDPKGSRKRFGALLVGVYDKGKLKYVGHIGGGYNQKLLEDIYELLQKMVSPTCPFIQQPKPNAKVTWVKPKLVCEASFAEWTKDGIMRQPIFKGMRIDKNAKSVIKEKPVRLKK